MAESVAPPAEGVALRLADKLLGSKTSAIILVGSEERAVRMAAALNCFDVGVPALVLPQWDCLPFDRVSPSRSSMGRRMSVLQQVMAQTGPAILVASLEAAMQRVPPRSAVRGVRMEIRTGDMIDRKALTTFAHRVGYVLDNRIDEPGELAIRGGVIDVFPPDRMRPLRLTLSEEDVVTEIWRFDPASQRTDDPVDVVELGPASEIIVKAGAETPERAIGAEHRLAEHYPRLESIFSYMPGAPVWLEPGLDDQREVLWTNIEEAHGSAREFGTGIAPLRPAKLYLDDAAWARALAGREMLACEVDGLEPLPAFGPVADAGRALAAFLGDAPKRIVVAAGDAARVATRVLRRSGLQLQEVAAWEAVGGAESPVALPQALEFGFIDRVADLVVIGRADLLGRSDAAVVVAGTALTGNTSSFEVGDVVVHEDHGIGILAALERIEVDGSERDMVRLEYKGDASVLVPVGEFGKLWRYGGDPEAVTLDRLDSDRWQKRRGEISAEIDAAARALVELARERIETKVEPAVPPAGAYRRLASRFPYSETPDQATAIAAVLDDLRSGHPMDRLVCGDVGFGKTEVALRAAAAVALSGRQVAIAAPTTVLVRQHLQSFERRFAGTGISVGQLSRLLSPAELKESKARIASGDLRIVVGTHALAGDGVRFADLGLVVIDEEQRFGARHKQKLRELGGGVHVLAMSATPIPRTLQSAMAGLQDVSVLATPPARRRPVRTFVSPYDSGTARMALLREQRRGGQSFVVVPRIEDIEGVRADLSEIVPDLSVKVAHGELPVAEIDAALVDFANGIGDVLLATNIVESGLDIPRANTMLIWRADRFGLAQLHQLRGRVGRGSLQAAAYLFTDADAETAEATRRRLATLETLDRLGAGFEISARDLDQRGAGDLMGEEQAGHLRLIGAGLYQRLLERALSEAKGEPVPDLAAVELNIGSTGSFPDDYVPEPGVRIDLYARLQRIGTNRELEAFADELEDRFGELPAEAQMLLDVQGVNLAAARLGVRRIDAGPLAIALTFAKKPTAQQKTAFTVENAAWKDDRLVWPVPTDSDAERLAAARRLLERLRRAA